MTTDRLIDADAIGNEDVALDRAIRPKNLADYTGQEKVCEQMEIFITAARERKEALDHVLIFGPPGLGKTTLANIVAHEMGCQFRSTPAGRSRTVATTSEEAMYTGGRRAPELNAFVQRVINL